MFRKIVSLALLISLIAICSSGLMMIILGDFAFQLQMHPVHKIFGVIFSIAGVLHLYLNFNPIKKYLSNKKLMVLTAILTFMVVGLYAIGLNKPLDENKINDITQIMKSME